MTDSPVNCPCGSSQTLDACCGQYLGGLPAPTAEALMRSRYTAFTQGRGDYLSETLSTKQREDFDIEDFESSAADTKWLDLEIKDTADGGENDQAGSVEFIARYRLGGQIHVHHELAFFIHEDEKWVFADCKMNPKQPQRIVNKIGRNEPCPCGSGKKYKKCCAA